jgi:radical SAM protein with 4Fe4S-binding SPASM domain
MILDGIHNIVKERQYHKKNRPKMTMQFIVMRHNEHELANALNFSKQHGFDQLKLKAVGINCNEELAKYLPANRRFNKYKTTGGSFVVKRKFRNFCPYLYLTSVINWNGDVVPCCWDLYCSHIFGNVFTNGCFGKIWNNVQLRSFRKQVRSQKKEIKICRNCPI